jgi:hypothetical protein
MGKRRVGNRPLPDIRIGSVTWSWKALEESYNFGSDLVAIRLCSRELWALKVPRLQPGHFRDNFGTPTWESREKEPFGCSPRGVENTIWGKVVASPESRPWWVLCVKVPVACPNTQGCPECELTLLWLVLGCRFKLDILVPLPNLIPGLLARPSTLLYCWKSGAPFKFHNSTIQHTWTLKWVQQGT